MSDRRAHWLRKNAAARIPRRVICLDSEAYIDRSVTRQEHSFRLASITFDRLDAEALESHDTIRMDFGDSYALWAWIDSFTSPGHRTVLFAHNASYDVRLTNGLQHLPALGWKCTALMPGSYGFWARWRRGERSLWLQDSLSYLPTPLEKLSGVVRIDKRPLPADEDDESFWIARCRADVEILRESMLRTIRFIHREDLGDWRVTGAAQASAAFRHRFLKQSTLLVHEDEDALQAERVAAYSGRAEVWRHGPTSAVLYEYDYEYAYARLAQTLDLPVRLMGTHGPIPRHRLERVMDHYAVLVDCTVDTDLPVVPCNLDGAINWPVGRFRSTLWDTELREVWRNGGSTTIHRYWFYRRAPVLKTWADWILAALDADSLTVDPVARIMLKSWSRSLIGRFGLRYSVLDQIAELPVSDLWGAHGSDLDAGTVGEYFQIGTQLFERTGRKESANSTPAIMSYIMAAGRMKLWEAMQVAGERNLYYVDTDGVIVGESGHRNLAAAIRAGALPGLRRKAVYSGGDFRSPRNVDLGAFRRVNGAPKKSARIEPGVYQGEVWESLPSSLARRRGDRVLVHERTFHVSENDRRRVHLDGGKTAPFVLGSDESTATTFAA